LPFKSKKAKVSGHRADLTGLFGKHRLLVGDVIRLRVGTETGVQLIEIEIRAGRAPTSSGADPRRRTTLLDIESTTGSKASC
jgi:hypothetical protein